MQIDVIDHVQMPDQTVVPLQDWQRGQPNGVATLNMNSKLVQSISMTYARQLPAPPPYSGVYNLVEWTYLKLIGEL